MAREDTIIVGSVVGLIVLPAVIALAAYYITKNPHFRPLGITTEKLSNADWESQSGTVIAEVTIGAGASPQSSQRDYSEALKTTFDRLGTDLRVDFLSKPNSSEITVTYIVGASRIGPYPIANAAAGVKAAVRAQRMAQSHSTSDADN